MLSSYNFMLYALRIRIDKTISEQQTCFRIPEVLVLVGIQSLLDLLGLFRERVSSHTCFLKFLFIIILYKIIFQFCYKATVVVHVISCYYKPADKSSENVSSPIHNEK